MICSSVNLDRFIVRPLPVAGLYSNPDEFPGLRSVSIISNAPLSAPYNLQYDNLNTREYVDACRNWLLLKGNRSFLRLGDAG